MQFIEKEQVVAFDCDDSLVIWDPAPELVDFTIDGIPVAIHHKHVAALKRFKARQQFVIVWSAGGALWAKEVVRLLELEPYVDLCMAKVSWAFDDRPLSELAELCYIGHPDDFRKKPKEEITPFVIYDPILPSDSKLLIPASDLPSNLKHLRKGLE